MSESSQPYVSRRSSYHPDLEQVRPPRKQNAIGVQRLRIGLHVRKAVVCREKLPTVTHVPTIRACRRGQEMLGENVAVYVRVAVDLEYGVIRRETDSKVVRALKRPLARVISDDTHDDKLRLWLFL